MTQPFSDTKFSDLTQDVAIAVVSVSDTILLMHVVYRSVEFLGSSLPVAECLVGRRRVHYRRSGVGWGGVGQVVPLDWRHYEMTSNISR